MLILCVVVVLRLVCHVDIGGDVDIIVVGSSDTDVDDVVINVDICVMGMYDVCVGVVMLLVSMMLLL